MVTQIIVDLENAACELALRPYREGLSLRAETRGAIERAARDQGGLPLRSVACTLAEARDLYDYFWSAADIFTTLGDSTAMVYARARDSAGRALDVAGERRR